jgi:hypothetical protein
MKDIALRRNLQESWAEDSRFGTATTMLFRVNFPRMPHDVVAGAMRFLAEQVRPRLCP